MSDSSSPRLAVAQGNDAANINAGAAVHAVQQICDAVLQRAIKLAEQSTVNLSESAKELAEQTKIQAENVRGAIDKANHAEIDDERVGFHQLLEELRHWAESADATRAEHDRLEAMLSYIEQRNVYYMHMLRSAEAALNQSSEAMSRMVMDLQFQDRVSQQVTSTIQLWDYMLEAVVLERLKEADIPEAVIENLIKTPSLSDVRQLLVDALRDAGVQVAMSSAEVANEASADEDDIDLF